MDFPFELNGFLCATDHLRVNHLLDYLTSETHTHAHTIAIKEKVYYKDGGVAVRGGIRRDGREICREHVY